MGILHRTANQEGSIPINAYRRYIYIATKIDTYGNNRRSRGFSGDRMAVLLKELFCFFAVLLSQVEAQENDGPHALYFIDSQRNSIYKMTGSGDQPTSVGSSNRYDNPGSLAHDPVRHYVYFTEKSSPSRSYSYSHSPNRPIHNNIGRLLDANNKKQFISLPYGSDVADIAVDYISNLLYVADRGTNVIQVIDFEEKTYKTLFKTSSKPRAIAVDPESGWMYWSSWGSSPKIEKVKMDGTGHDTVVNTNLTWPIELALDKPARRLYFCDLADTALVQSVDLDDGGRTVHSFNSSEIYKFWGMAIDENYIYLTSWNHKDIFRTSKATTNESTFGSFGNMNSSYAQPRSIVLAGSSYQEQGQNACYSNNGGCSHYCLPVPGGRTCACPDGMRLNDQQCEDEETSSLLYFINSTNSIFKMAASGGRHIHVGDYNMYSGIIGHDPLLGYIYWIDRSQVRHPEHRYRTLYRYDIKRLSLATGQTDSMSLPHSSSPKDIAVDYTSNIIYVLDSGYKGIRAVNFKDQTSITILRLAGMYSSDYCNLELDPESGWMYWSEGRSVKMAKMDGTDQQTLTSGYTTSGLALDKLARRLYICASGFVMSIHVDRSRNSSPSFRSYPSSSSAGSRVITHFSDSSARYSFFGIALDEHYIYLTSRNGLGYILRMQKIPTGQTTPERLGSASLSSVQLSGLVLSGSSYQTPGSSACSLNNGGCSHYCLPVPDGRVCVCPDDMVQKGQQCENRTSDNPRIRLVGGQDPSEGRVEIYMDRSWGTVCDNNWDNKDAKVVCNMLGISGRAKAYSRAHYGQGSGVVHMNYVGCTGTETSLFNCQHSGFGNVHCRHIEDAGVKCGLNETCPGDSKLNGTLWQKVRLVNGPNRSAGRVEICVGGEWGTVCDDGWDDNDAAVVCNMLGMGRKGKAVSGARYGRGSESIHMAYVRCNGHEDSIFSCGSSGVGFSCGHHEDAGVICEYNSCAVNNGGCSHFCLSGSTGRVCSCPNGMRLNGQRCEDEPTYAVIRLVGGQNPSEGRVEIYVNGEWGTVCDDSWDDNDAMVVCNMLGISGVAKAVPNSQYKSGSGAAIHFDDVSCTGSEDSIFACGNAGFGIHNCGHHEDAAVICASDSESTSATTVFRNFTSLETTTLKTTTQETTTLLQTLPTSSSTPTTPVNTGDIASSSTPTTPVNTGDIASTHFPQPGDLSGCDDSQWHFSEKTRLCYSLQTSPAAISWDVAEYICRTHNAHLACPSTATKLAVVGEVIRKAQLWYYSVWIGLHHERGASGRSQQQRREGWGWVDGSPYEFRAWNQGEPGQGDRYASMQEGKLLGVVHGSYSYFVCQKASSQTAGSKRIEVPLPQHNTKATMLPLLVLLAVPVICAVIFAVVMWRRQHKTTSENGKTVILDLNADAARITDCNHKIADMELASLGELSNPDNLSTAPLLEGGSEDSRAKL